MAILEVSGLKKYFPVTGGVLLRQIGHVKALDDISFKVQKGETLGIVGESGCGKTTLGRCVAGLYPPTAGDVFVKGRNLRQMSRKQKKRLALDLQVIFQDPFESLNPRQTIREILSEKYLIHGYRTGGDLDAEIRTLIRHVGLPETCLDQYPHEFSGGQRQRIGIARAISMDPEIIVCDEAVSALDVSVQSKILNLLLDLQAKMDLTFLFISHNLSVVRHISDRIAVMYLGKIVEVGDTERLYHHPMHPYTHALLSAIPRPDPDGAGRRTVLRGEVPSAQNPPPGCAFHTRCPHAQQICTEQLPEMCPVNGDAAHLTACHLLPFR